MEQRKKRSSHTNTRSGCITCKLRHKKCDETYPECRQCTLANRKCAGYTQLPDKRTRAWRSLREGVDQSQPEKQQQCVLVNPSTISSRPAFRDQINWSFFEMHFPINSSKKGQDFHVDHFEALFMDIAALPTKTLMLEQAISAVSCVFLGKVDNNEAMLQHGLQLYNSSMRHMSRLLTREACSADLAYTAMIYQEIEAIHCPQSLKGFLVHVLGTSSILNRYRPQLLANPLTSVIYQQHQKGKLLIATNTNMTEEDYAYISQPAPNDPMHDLIQIIADIFLLSRASDSIHASQGEACQNLLLGCIAQMQRHTAWYSRWEERIGGGPSLYAPGELNSRLPPTDNLFGPAYRFLSVDNARLHIFFWVASALLRPLLYRAQYLVNLHQGQSLIVKPEQLHQEYQISIGEADKVARSFPYCAQDGMKARSVSYGGFFAAKQLAKIYSDNRCLEKFLWVKEVFVHMAGSGYDSGARGVEMVSNMWPLDDS